MSSGILVINQTGAPVLNASNLQGVDKLIVNAAGSVYGGTFNVTGAGLLAIGVKDTGSAVIAGPAGINGPNLGLTLGTDVKEIHVGAGALAAQTWFVGPTALKDSFRMIDGVTDIVGGSFFLPGIN